MSVYGEFFTKFMEPFFEGLLNIFKGIGEGLGQMFNVVNYITVVSDYKSDLTGVGLVIMILSIILLLEFISNLLYCLFRASWQCIILLY